VPISGERIIGVLRKCRFPPPWSVEQQDACFVVRDHSLATRTTKIIQGRARHIGSKIQDGRNARGSPLTGHIA